MSARRFIKEDLPQINRWQALLEMPLTTYEDLPAIGYIVPGICAGFLFQTDSSVCMLDGYIANPEVLGSKRKEALNAVTDLLIITAKDLDYKKIIAFTRHESVKARCERYEFSQKEDYTLFVRRI